MKKQEIDKLLAQYQPQIVEIIDKVNDTLDLVENVMPIALKASLEDIMSTFSDVVSDFNSSVADGTFNSAKVYEYQSKMIEKANQVLALIKEDIGNEKYNQCQTVIANRQQSLDQLKATMENAIAQAENQAKSFLNGLKQGRKEN